MRERLVFVAAVLLVFSCGTPALAQTAGTIAGTVTDASDAAVPGVTVTARNSDTGLTRTVVTGAQGGTSRCLCTHSCHQIVRSGFIVARDRVS